MKDELEPTGCEKLIEALRQVIAQLESMDGRLETIEKAQPTEWERRHGEKERDWE